MTPCEFATLAPGPAAVLLTDLEKSSLDDRDYRVIRLPNGLEVLLVHDPETDKASAGLDVNVGSFSDEDDMPGMAHAVEHLLLMGTKKFPKEDEFRSYLSANSGRPNAYTASTSTNYHFEVAAKPADDQHPTEDNPSPLRSALDRFSQFFIEPLFNPDTLDRELKAVDSENKKNLQDDGWRLRQLRKSLWNPQHPYSRFCTGNLDVLKIEPEAKGINVWDKFIEFYQKNYSANRMKLVVLGREPLDVLQKWTEEFFSCIVNKKLPQNRWEDESPFRESELGTQCFAKPVMDLRTLYLEFPFLDEEHLYDSQPSWYISHLIGHEGAGSILSYLKNKGLVNSLTARALTICPGSPDIFIIETQLTEEGLENYPEIIRIIFQYMSLLRESPPHKWIFEEQQEMADVDFKFKEKTPAMCFAITTSAEMQKPMPREWLLSGQSRLRQFDPKAIEEGLAKICPENMRLIVVSQKFPGDWDEKEKWYGTEYRYEKLPESHMAAFRAALRRPSDKPLAELHLPHKNIFIPNELEVEKKEVLQPALSPCLLRNDGLARTWWKKDDTFWVPKGSVTVSLKSPIIYASAENVVKAKIFTELVRDALEEYAYGAKLAGLHYTVSLGSRGLLLKISGYNDGLRVLLQQVASTLRHLDIREERFEVIKERATRGYSNWQLNSAYQQVGNYLNCLISEREYLMEELAAELLNVTCDSIRLFQEQVLSQMYMEMFAHGNLHKEDALKITNILESTLNSRALPRSQLPIARSLLLPPGANYIYNKTLQDPANVNHCVETWLYIGNRADYDLRAKTLLLEQIAHEPAFNQLRTKEQLGYLVFTGIRNFATTYGFRILIQSEQTPEYLDTRIEAFLVQLGDIIDNMSDTDFEGHKHSLIIKRLEKPKNLEEETRRHWNQISGEYYDFESRQNDATHVKPLTKADIQEFYKTYVSPSSAKRARISVHLHARETGELDTKIIELLKQTSLDNVPAEQRQNLDLLEKYLKEEAKLAADQVSTILKQVEEHGLKPAAPNRGSASMVDGTAAVKKATAITDIRLFQGGLLSSQGPHSNRDLGEFENINPIL